MSDLIKREDAIKYFAEFLSLNRFADFKNVNIEKLVGKLCERIPSVEPKTGDFIEREDAIQIVKDCSFSFDDNYHEVNGFAAVKGLQNLPTAEPKQGKWIRKESWSRGVGMGEVYGWYFECSVCGCLSEGSVNDAGNYCPNCGCRMKGADDE